MSIYSEAAGLPSVTASMVSAPVAQCTRCGADIYHQPAYIPLPTDQPCQVNVVPACPACAPIMEREAEAARLRHEARRIDAAVQDVRVHLTAIEEALMHAPSPFEMQLPASVNDDWAVLCHASRLLFYLAKRFNATSLVDTDIAARGMGDH